MKKFYFIILVTIFLLSAVLVIQLIFISSQNLKISTVLDEQRTEIQDTKTIFLEQQNLQNLFEERFVKLSLNLNISIEELLLKIMHQSKSLNRLIEDIGSKGLIEVKELKDILFIYIEEGEKYKAAERLRTSRVTVESDLLVQTLFDKGLKKYSNKEYTGAVKIYKEILDINPNNKEAIFYFYASLYYQNPGDSTHYSNIKDNLAPLLEADILTKEEESTVLNILKGISLEEGNR